MDSDNVFARYYSIGCECCQEQYALWMLSGLPPPPRRKAAAANGDLYKGLMQCQFCFKSKLEGVKLLKCGNCQTEFYCVRLPLLLRRSLCAPRAADSGPFAFKEQRMSETGVAAAQAEMRAELQEQARRRRAAEADQGPPRVHGKAPAHVLRGRRRRRGRRAGPRARGGVRARDLPAPAPGLDAHGDELLRVRDHGRAAQRVPAGAGGGDARAAADGAQPELADGDIWVDRGHSGVLGDGRDEHDDGGVHDEWPFARRGELEALAAASAE